MSKEVMQQVLEDCESHYQAWRSALEFAQTKATNEADQSYWSHELKAFDRTFKALAPAAPQPAPVQEELVSKAMYNRLRDDYNDLVKESEQAAKYAKEWRAHVNRCQLLGVDLDYQITAPQPAQQGPVALDVTLEGEKAQALYDLLGDDREDLSPLRLLVGDGHSGYGLYVALAEYQDEGAELIAWLTPPAQPAPMQAHVGTVRELFKLGAWEELDVIGSTKVYLDAPPAQPAQTEQEPGVKGYAMALNEIALKLRERYKTDLLSTPLWAEFEKARNKLAASIAAPQPAQRKPLTEAQQVECLVKAGCIGTVLMSFESGPYDITRPSINASRLIEQVEAAHDIKEQK